MPEAQLLNSVVLTSSCSWRGGDTLAIEAIGLEEEVHTSVSFRYTSDTESLRFVPCAAARLERLEDSLQV